MFAEKNAQNATEGAHIHKEIQEYEVSSDELTDINTLKR